MQHNLLSGLLIEGLNIQILQIVGPKYQQRDEIHEENVNRKHVSAFIIYLKLEIDEEGIKWKTYTVGVKSLSPVDIYPFFCHFHNIVALQKN